MCQPNDDTPSRRVAELDTSFLLWIATNVNRCLGNSFISIQPIHIQGGQSVCSFFLQIQGIHQRFGPVEVPYFLE